VDRLQAETGEGVCFRRREIDYGRGGESSSAMQAKSPMALSWYLARLRNMDAAEIAHRVVERLRRAYSRRRHEGWTRFGGGDSPLELPGLREAVLKADAPMRAAIGETAGAVLAGRFSALGVTWPAREEAELFPKTLWRQDPVTGKDWPGEDTYCFDIDFRQVGDLGDIKYVWEINRLQILQPLAAQALLTGDADPVAAIETAIASWHAANPPFRGVGWGSGIEIALRAISLLVATSLCGERLSPGTLAKVRQILAASAFWLHRFPSHHSSANNHLMAELAGQYLIACALGGKTQPLKAEIENQVQKQILPDGVGAEQSPSYAAFTAEMALLCAIVARAAETPFSGEAEARLRDFSSFVFWLSGDGRTAPAIGDDDEGRALTLCRHETDYVTSVATAIAAHGGHPAPMIAPRELRNLLAGEPAGLAAAGNYQGLRTFETGGYSVWRGTMAGRAVDLVFDHGPLGYLSIAAHGHADALSVVLAVDGQPVLVDPGTYLYQSGGSWRGWFRGTRAHNTLNIDGADQSIIAGPFNWSSKARARLDERAEGPSWSLRASHDGYEKRFGVRHRRGVAGTENGFVITDALTGPGAPREAEIVFQAAAGLSAAAQGNVVNIRRGEQVIVQIDFPTADIAIARGGEIGAGGWVSAAFGSKQQADRIAWRGQVGAEGVASNVMVVRVPDSFALG
jgi:hypothetical protein